MKNLFFCFLIASFLISCQSESKKEFNLEVAKKEIEAANSEISKYMQNGDSVSMALAYSSDGSAMFANMPSIKGKDNLTAAWGGLIRAGMSNIELTTVEVWGDDHYLTEEGLFVIKTKEGVQIEKGKYLVLWKKEDGKWKLHRDMSSSDLPVATTSSN